MDNPATESSGALDANQAASLFADMLGEPEKAPAEPARATEAPAIEAEAPEAEQEAAEPSEEEQLVTIKVDGKEVQVPLSELKNGYQRQTDYTRKTMAAAEQAKTAQAETAKARAERETYGANLQRMQAQLEGALQEQRAIDFKALLESDPVEYLKQQHLLQERQATLGQVHAERAKVEAQSQAERTHSVLSHLAEQREYLTAKLPAWKDETKAQAEKKQIAEFMAEAGYTPDEIFTKFNEDGSLKRVGLDSDAKAILVFREAMLYRKMMASAQAAAKKVSTLPTKVERPGLGESPNLDRRSTAFQKLSKSGRVEDAASVFASFLS